MRKLIRILALLAFALAFAGMAIRHRTQDEIVKESRKERTLERRLIRLEETDEEDNLYDEMKKINPDYEAMLVFDSGLIHLPVVQGKDNSFYLNHLFDGSPGTAGALFFDMQCEREDTVRIIYGHTVFGQEDLMFTPLHRLCGVNAVKENSTFFLAYEETREIYEIAAVMIQDEDDETAADTRIRGFSAEEDERNFLNVFQERSLYVNTDHLFREGRLLILQTCMDPESSRRLCVLAREKAS